MANVGSRVNDYVISIKLADSKGTYPLSVFVENLSPVNSLKFYQGLAYFEFVVYKLPLVELVESEEGRAAGMREEARAEAEAQAKEDLEREVAELAEVPKNLPEGPRPTMLHVRTLQASVAAGEAAEIAAGGPKTTAAETREFLVTSATCKVFRQKDNNEEYMQQTQEFSDLSDADMDDEEIEMALAADSPKSPQPGVQNKASTKPTAEALGEKTKEAADTDIGRDGGGSDKGSRSLRPPQPKRGGVLDNPTETATPKVSRQTSAPGKGPRTPPPSRRSRSPAAGATPTPRGATAFARGDARGDQEDLAGGGKERAEAEKKDKN